MTRPISKRLTTYIEMNALKILVHSSDHILVHVTIDDDRRHCAAPGHHTLHQQSILDRSERPAVRGHDRSGAVKHGWWLTDRWVLSAGGR